MKAVFLDADGLEEFDLTPIRSLCSNLTIYSTSRPEQVQQRIETAELLIINKVKITRRHFENTKSLRLICMVATGTDAIDQEAAAEFGVKLCNCRAYGTDSVVQHVFSFILALSTNLLNYHGDVQRGRWQETNQFCFLDHPIFELRGKTLGILGYGTLGRAVAEVAKAFGMKVIVCRRPGGPKDDRPTLAEMLPQVDFLTLHCPLTEQTQNIINAKSLQALKPSAILINCARGGLVEEEPLLAALRGKKIGGAGLDVLREEPPRTNPLLEVHLPNLLITPHTAWASQEARQRIIEQTAENIQAFLGGTPIREVTYP